MDTILAYLGNFPYFGIFILLLLGGVGLPFPEDATLILAGFLISTEVVRPVYALAVVYAGVLIADFTLYSIGREYGRKVAEHRRLHRLLPPERLSALEEKFNRRGVLLILAGRHLAGLRAQLLIVAGVMKMPRLKFILADAAAAVITIAVMVGIGYRGGESLQVVMKDIRRVEHVAVLAGVAAILAYILYRSLRSRRAG